MSSEKLHPLTDYGDSSDLPNLQVREKDEPLGWKCLEVTMLSNFHCKCFLEDPANILQTGPGEHSSVADNHWGSKPQHYNNDTITHSLDHRRPRQQAYCVSTHGKPEEKLLIHITITKQRSCPGCSWGKQFRPQGTGKGHGEP